MTETKKAIRFAIKNNGDVQKISVNTASEKKFYKTSLVETALESICAVWDVPIGPQKESRFSNRICIVKLFLRGTIDDDFLHIPVIFDGESNGILRFSQS